MSTYPQGRARPSWPPRPRSTQFRSLDAARLLRIVLAALRHRTPLRPSADHEWLALYVAARLVATGIVSAGLIAAIIAWLIGFGTQVTMTNGVVTSGAGLFGCSIVGLAVTVEVPLVGERLVLGVGRPTGVERHLEGCLARVRLGRRAGDRRA